MPIMHILNATRSAIFRAYGWKVISTTHVPTYVQPLLGKIVYALSSFLLIFFLVYKDEVGGWAPPTELSQSSGAAAHTYTWFSLTTYLLIYNVILEILFISRIQYSPVRRERGGGFVKAIIFLGESFLFHLHFALDRVYYCLLQTVRLSMVRRSL